MSEVGVLCAIDVNDYDQDVIDLAAQFAKHFGCDLDLLHVTLMPDPTKAAWPAYVGAPNELIQDHRLFKKIGTNIEGVIVRRRHLSGLPSQKVIEFVENRKPKLLVLGTHARTGLSRVFGSVATKIMRKVDCPVVLLRQKQNSQSFDFETQNSV